MSELTLSEADGHRPASATVIPIPRLLAVRDLSRMYAREEGVTDPGELESCVRAAEQVLAARGSADRAVRQARITAQAIVQADRTSEDIEGALGALVESRPLPASVPATAALASRGRLTVPRHQLSMLRRAAGELLNVARDNRDSLVATYGDEHDQMRHPEEARTLAELEFEIARAQRALDAFDKACPLDG